MSKRQQSTEYVLKQTQIDLSHTAGSIDVQEFQNFDQTKRRKSGVQIKTAVFVSIIGVLSLLAVGGLVWFAINLT